MEGPVSGLFAVDVGAAQSLFLEELGLAGVAFGRATNHGVVALVGGRLPGRGWYTKDKGVGAKLLTLQHHRPAGDDGVFAQDYAVVQRCAIADEAVGLDVLGVADDPVAQPTACHWAINLPVRSATSRKNRA